MVTPTIPKVKPSLRGGDSRSAGVVAGATTAAKRQKRAVKSEAYKVSNNRSSPHWALRSQGGISPDYANNDVINDKEVEEDESVGGVNALAWANTALYDEDVNVKEGGSGLRHGMAELEAAMSVLVSTAARFAE
jgi:hypothetical protein